MKTIVWDLDDVLNELTREWLGRSEKCESPKCLLPFAELRHNPPNRDLGVPRMEYLECIERFRLSDQGRNLPPAPQVLDWFRARGHLFHHVVLTARPASSVPSAAEWVFRNFGAWVRGFYFASNRAGERKADVLARLGLVDYFVDDSRENVDEACAMGIRGLLFPQPWNPEAMPLQDLLGELRP